jgi:membrane-bound lytic murein transglycosylase MltF
LAAQGYQESGLKSGLRSRAGAVGVMQIKPSTAAGAPIDIRVLRRSIAISRREPNTFGTW